jgi:hypothetical protein
MVIGAPLTIVDVMFFPVALVNGMISEDDALHHINLKIILMLEIFIKFD